MSSLKTTNILHPSSASNNIVLDSSGNIAVQAGTAAAPAIQANGDSNTGIYFPAADTIAFTEGGTEACRIDSSGRLLIGTSTARSNFDNTTNSAALQVEGTNDSTNSVAIISNANSQYVPAHLRLAKSRGTSTGSNTVVQSGDLIGTVQFQGSDGTEFVDAASILAEVDGTPGANDMPGRLVFSTTADGASSPTERMRISSAGHFGFYGTDPATEVRSLTSGYGLRLLNNSFQESAFGNSGYWIFNNTASSGTRALIYFRVQGVDKGSITSDGSTTAYNTSSDYRLKENIVPLTGAADRLNQLQVHRFNFIANPDKTVDGFIAHEAQAVVPECVTGEKDAVDDEGNPVYQGIDQSKLVPLLTAALQETIAELQALKAEVAALKAQ